MPPSQTPSPSQGQPCVSRPRLCPKVLACTLGLGSRSPRLCTAPPSARPLLCFTSPPTPPRVRRKVGVSCAGGAQEGEREVRGTQAGARGQLALVPSMAWGGVGVGLSTGQQTPSASPAAAQERHTGFRGPGCAATGAAAPHWGGHQQPFPSPGGLGLFWKSHLAPASCPWTAPPRRGAASTSLLGTAPPAPRGQSGTVCTTWGSRATAQLLTSLHCPLSPRERVCQTNPDPQAHTGLSPAWLGTPQQGSKASKEPRCCSPL